MKKLFLLLLAVSCLLSFVISCSGLGKIPDTVPDIIIEKPEPPANIMGKGNVSAEKMALFLLQNNPNTDKSFAHSLTGFYVEEAAFEGVNHDVAFAQMCLETGFLRFGGDVKPQQYNFCGLGAVGGGEPGLSFPEPRIGVRAQIQHLKAYASEEPLKGENVDPRFRYVRRGSSPGIEGLAGTWAADRQYAVKINGILQRLFDFSF
ncbi:MAG: glucosaminidase domain-containing protein [Treponema sp.]|nr:glucosaminidase domain-containing protein [Treponema sp.]